jgi:acetyltransferase
LQVLAECTDRVWDEFDGKRLLKACGVPTVEETIVQSAAAAQAAARKTGYPVVLKGLVPGKVHKTEVGLVITGIASAGRLKEAFTELAARMKGKGRILLQRQMPTDYELIAGVLKDTQFGPCVMFGIGGIFSELIKDVTFAPAPLSQTIARKLIRRISGQKLLMGFRGAKALDMKKMADILVALGDLAAACPEIEQIDVNPFIVHQGIPVAVDAAVIVGGE